jgi:hypothetical protein
MEDSSNRTGADGKFSDEEYMAGSGEGRGMYVSSIRLRGTGSVAGRTVQLLRTGIHETLTTSIPVACEPAGSAIGVFITGRAGEPTLPIDGVAGMVTEVKLPILLSSTSDAEKGMSTVNSPAIASVMINTDIKAANFIISPSF